MKNRPILFSTPMVQAIMGGKKTETRRVLKLIGFGEFKISGYDWQFRNKEMFWNCVTNDRLLELAPYQVGDVLWVRETWAEVGGFDPGLIIYKANYPECVPAKYENIPDISKIKWKPSIFMLKTSCRIFLKVESVYLDHYK